MIVARRLQIFNPARTGPYPWLLALAVIVLVVQLMRLFFAVVTPIGPVGAWRPAMAEIIPASERAGLLSAFDPYYRSDAPASGGAARVTSLDLTLFGVTLNRATGQGSAIVAGPDGVQNSVLVGEEVAPGATLAEVGEDHVWIETGGSREILYLDQSVPAAEVAPGVEPMSGGQASAGSDEEVSAPGPAAIAEGLSIAPRREGDAVTGLIVSPQGDGSVFTGLGFQQGDVVVSANGRPLRSTADLMGLMRPGARLSLQVERGARTRSIAITLD